MTYKANESWLQDNQNPDLWYAENGLIVNSAALQEREFFFEVERIYTSEKEHEVWTQDDLDSDLWHGEHGVLVNTAALDEREAVFEVERVYAIEPYLNMRDYDCASC